MASLTAAGCSSMMAWPPSMVASVRSVQSSRIGPASGVRCVAHTASRVAWMNSTGRSSRPKLGASAA